MELILASKSYKHAWDLWLLQCGPDAVASLQNGFLNDSEGKFILLSFVFIFKRFPCAFLGFMNIRIPVYCAVQYFKGMYMWLVFDISLFFCLLQFEVIGMKAYYTLSH